MDIVYVIFRLMLFAWVLFLPQLLGLLLHFRLKRFPILASHLEFWLTLVSSLFLLIITLMPEQTDQNGCGMGTLAAVMMAMILTAVQAVVSAIAQFWFYRKYRT